MNAGNVTGMGEYYLERKDNKKFTIIFLKKMKCPHITFILDIIHLFIVLISSNQCHFRKSNEMIENCSPRTHQQMAGKSVAYFARLRSYGTTDSHVTQRISRGYRTTPKSNRRLPFESTSITRPYSQRTNHHYRR